MTSKTGLLLVNLGSPDSPTPNAVRKYLGEFLHDYRVVDLNRWLWCPILHGIILRTRPKRVAEAYASIWDQPDGISGGEAPLIRITRRQAAGLQERLGEGVCVEVAMRYGNPSIKSSLDKLLAAGCKRIAVLPAYPQYAGATVASIFDAVGKAVKQLKDVPDIRFIRNYYDHPMFISALGESIKEHLGTLDWVPETIMASYHGIPKRYVTEGDPYEQECVETTRLLRSYLDLDDEALRMTFQSRFGREEWLQPYTDKTFEALPGQGIKNIAVVMPGFSADCLETSEEIAIEGAEIFREHGGVNFTAIPCLNDDPTHLDALAAIAKERLLAGWI
ncbi:MAG: ferrochelatase [Maricaulaceae bacterium]